MSALPQQKWTTLEYLAFERASETKHEFINGEIFAMDGASQAHNLLCTTCVGMLYAQLLNRSCQIYASDMRVKMNASGDYTYPDIAIVCGEPACEDAEVDTLLNPTVIIEVLSPSTEKYDRGLKFQNYRAPESLQEYLAISQEHIRSEHYVRQDHHWLFADATQLDEAISLPSIDGVLPLAQVYQQIRFEQPD